ncbi:hypothetical protein MUK42_13878 [Musa troglodytarum]|uniref:Uncharacterized protein n=1 Tax=Musa troglodytarum TaxID=320322 RepID=A0A9E7I0K1_9LILI|nr:hypothetical protein MUK42_13878 [Musa troglodytarum]
MVGSERGKTDCGFVLPLPSQWLWGRERERDLGLVAALHIMSVVVGGKSLSSFDRLSLQSTLFTNVIGLCMDGLMDLISREASAILKSQELGSISHKVEASDEEIDFIMLKHDPEKTCHQKMIGEQKVTVACHESSRNNSRVGPKSNSLAATSLTNCSRTREQRALHLLAAVHLISETGHPSNLHEWGSQVAIHKLCRGKRQMLNQSVGDSLSVSIQIDAGSIPSTAGEVQVLFSWQHKFG